jgi:hypothetical protein
VFIGMEYTDGQFILPPPIELNSPEEIPTEETSEESPA